MHGARNKRAHLRRRRETKDAGQETRVLGNRQGHLRVGKPRASCKEREAWEGAGVRLVVTHIIFIFAPRTVTRYTQQVRRGDMRGAGLGRVLRSDADLPEHARTFTVAWRCRGVGRGVGGREGGEE
jgi:hypothetical protein